MSKEMIVRGFITFFLLSCIGAHKDGCKHQEDLISRCNVALPVLSSPDINFPVTQGDLDKSCVELQAGIRCIDNYTEVCMEKPMRATFRMVYSGITGVVNELCKRGDYQDEYLRHANCVKKVRPEYEVCSKRYEVTLTRLAGSQNNEQYVTDGVQPSHEDHLRTVCCSVQDYLQCSERTVEAECGEEAARFTSNFLKRMASNIITNYCLEYKGEECAINDNSTHIKNSITNLLGIGLFAHVVLKYMAGNVL